MFSILHKYGGKGKCVLLLPLLLSSCLSAYSRRGLSPSLYSGYRTKYPSESYLLGVGTSPLSSGLSVARRRAKEAAFREIAEEIRVRIESSITDVFGLGTKPRIEVYSRSTVDEVLEGVRIVEATPLKRRGIYLVVAVLPRKEVIGRLSREIERRDLERKRLMERAQVGGGVLGRLKALGRCERVLLQEMALYRNMEALAGSFRIERPSPELPLSAVEEEIERLLLSLKMLERGGEGTVENPLKVKVLYGPLPLKGIPLRWSLAAKQGEIEGDALTDEKGMGRAVIKGMFPPGPGEVWAEIDLKELIGRDLFSIWEKSLFPRVIFSPQLGMRGAVQSLLENLTSSGLYGIDIFVAGFSSRDEKAAEDLTLALKDCLAQNLLFQLVESTSGYPYILKGKVEELDSRLRIMADLTRRGRVITTASVFVEKSRLGDRKGTPF